MTVSQASVLNPGTPRRIRHRPVLGTNSAGEHRSAQEWFPKQDGIRKVQTETVVLLWIWSNWSFYMWEWQLAQCCGKRLGNYLLKVNVWSYSYDPAIPPLCLLFSPLVTSDSLRPYGTRDNRLSCPLLSPRVCSNSCPLSWCCHPNNHLLCLHPQSVCVYTYQITFVRMFIAGLFTIVKTGNNTDFH